MRLEALKGPLEVQEEEKEERGMNDFVNVDHFFHASVADCLCTNGDFMYKSVFCLTHTRPWK